MLRTGAVSSAGFKIMWHKRVRITTDTVCWYWYGNSHVFFVFTALHKFVFQILYWFVSFTFNMLYLFCV